MTSIKKFDFSPPAPTLPSFTFSYRVSRRFSSPKVGYNLWMNPLYNVHTFSSFFSYNIIGRLKSKYRRDGKYQAKTCFSSSCLLLIHTFLFCFEVLLFIIIFHFCFHLFYVFLSREFSVSRRHKLIRSWHHRRCSLSVSFFSSYHPEICFVFCSL